MKRVLKPNGNMIIIGIDPNTGKGHKICEFILHTGANFYDPYQLRKKVEGHNLKGLSIKSTNLDYFLTTFKNIWKISNKLYNGIYRHHKLISIIKINVSALHYYYKSLN